MGNNRLNKDDIVSHFKRETLSDEYKRKSNKYLYRIIDVALDVNTDKKVVIYKALYKPFQIFTRPYNDFMAEVDEKEHPMVEQKYRFEKVNPTWRMILNRVTGR